MARKIPAAFLKFIKKKKGTSGKAKTKAKGGKKK
jgi:hypothetical protein